MKKNKKIKTDFEDFASKLDTISITVQKREKRKER